MTLFDAMQADHCWQLPDGSADRPFSQKHLTDCMRIRRKRQAMWQQKSVEECRNFPRKFEESRVAGLASGLYPIPLYPRRRWAISPHDLDISDLLVLTEKVSAKEDCLRDLMMAQAEKIRAWKDLHCSEGLARQIRRLVLEEDLEL